MLVLSASAEVVPPPARRVEFEHAQQILWTCHRLGYFPIEPENPGQTCQEGRVRGVSKRREGGGRNIIFGGERLETPASFRWVQELRSLSPRWPRVCAGCVEAQKKPTSALSSCIVAS